MPYLILIMVIALSGCNKVISKEDRFIAISHPTRDSAFQDAYDEAKAYCRDRGLIAKKVNSECPFRCVSDFECVE